MGVEKINYHKQTRFHPKTNFRQAICPVCQDWVYVMSYQDDTRWRYIKHKNESNQENCLGSYELVPAAPG